jgi:farnesyl-diphosphate farnesyltransferase
MNHSQNIEAPSGKTRTDENFPVGSWLIARPLRPHIHAFYAFARNADDIADSPTLPPAEKIARLNTMEDVLRGNRQDGSPTAAALRESLQHTGVTATHARDLLHAFRHDSLENRTPSWPKLMEYCRYSAMPVGRYVLDLHGESEDAWPHSDALCAALQILNHLQDCADDFAELDRCYLPNDLLAAAGASVEDLTAARETPALRRVFTTLLNHCDELNRAAAALPHEVRDRRLRVECATIVNLARRRAARLRRDDPLAMRVKLTKPDFVFSLIRALPWLT